MPVVSPVGLFPPKYEEVQTVLSDDTISALRMAIVGHFGTNRNRQMWEIRCPIADFPDGVALDCPSMEIYNVLWYQDKLNWLPLLEDYVARIQLIW